MRGAYLLTALDNIEWADGGVGKTAGEDTAGHALSVVGCVVNVSHCFVFFQYGF